MWTRRMAAIAAAVVFSAAGTGWSQSASDLMQKAVYAEETQGKIDEAMQLYSQIVRDAQAARPAVAQAYYRLGACYLKKNQKNEARQVFEALTTHFSDQTDLVAKAREQLTKLGGSAQQATPQIVSIMPAVGATDVDPALDKITVVFDQDMAGGFSWTGGGPEFPQTTGKPSWVDKRTCILPVKLEPGKYYRLGINSTSHKNFRSAAGVPVQPHSIYFTTKGADAQAVAKTQVPTVAQLDPPNGAADVDPNRTTISIMFSQPMGSGMSWCGGGQTFPERAGNIAWDESRTICTMPVKLRPGQKYTIGINSPSHRNFMSQSGVPVEPVVWTFTTKQ